MGRIFCYSGRLVVFPPRIFKPLTDQSLCAFHLLYKWYQRRGDFPQGHRTSNSALPDVPQYLQEAENFSSSRFPPMFLSRTLWRFFCRIDGQFISRTIRQFRTFCTNRLQRARVFLPPEWKLRSFFGEFQSTDPNKKNRGCKYISRVKDKQFAEAKHLFQIQITRTKSIYSLKTTVASLQATLSTAVMKLNELLFQRQYTKN